MDEKLTAPPDPKTEIDSLLFGKESLPTEKMVQRQDQKTLPGGIEVSIATREKPDNEKRYWLHVYFPMDEMNRHISEDFDLTARKYKKVLNRDVKAGESSTILDSRIMTEVDNLTVLEWLDKFKTAIPSASDEAVDEDKKEK